MEEAGVLYDLQSLRGGCLRGGGAAVGPFLYLQGVTFPSNAVRGRGLFLSERCSRTFPGNWYRVPESQCHQSGQLLRQERDTS